MPASYTTNFKTYYKRKRADKPYTTSFVYEAVSVAELDDFQQAFFEANVTTDEGGYVPGVSNLYYSDKSVASRSIVSVRDGGSVTVLGKSKSGSSSSGSGGGGGGR